jgi:fengycin family lipopeptide synthetase D
MYLLNVGKKLTTLRYLFIGAEKLTVDLVKRSIESVSGHCRLFNMYGPTETTIISAVLEIHRERVEQYSVLSGVPIGKPVGNTDLLVLDRQLHLCPFQVMGELHIAGDGVARGYLNNPELTAEKFGRAVNSHLSLVIGSSLKTIDNSSKLSTNDQCPMTNDRLYKTGDLTRWLPDGTIEFLGRIDHQVKIRGFRIEIGEIESRLLAHHEVKAALVLQKVDETGDRYLCAYVVCVDSAMDEDTHSSAQELKKYLSQSLPDYMIPSYIILLAEMPLNQNGKIHRKALPEPEFSVSSQFYTAPGNEIEKKLAEMWKKLLKVEKIGIHDSFFDIGGHSLKALQLVNAIKKEFNTSVNINDIFLFPTIARMYELIGCRKKTEEQKIELQPEKEYYELSYSQKRLWLLIQLDPDSPAFNLPVRLTLHERVDESIVRKVLETLVERHESFRTYIKIAAGNPAQVILPRIPVQMEVVDISHLDENSRTEMRYQLFHHESTMILKLGNPPLFRFKLVKYSNTEFDLVVTMHHIISDGWSMEILENEFNLLYESYKNSDTGNLDPLRIRYRDYVSWHNRLVLDEEGIKSAKDFWESQLRGKNTVLDLPYDYPMPSTKIKDSSGYRCVVPGEIVDGLRKIANQQQASLFMVLLAGFNIVLSQVTGQEDILVGVPGAARQHEDLKNIVGFFVNTLVLLERVNPEEPFLDFLSRVQTKTFQVLEYQSYPLEMICSQYKIPYPEVSVFFNMSSFGDITNRLLTDDACFHLEKVQDAKFDMVCYLGEYKNGIEIETHYYKMLFDPFTIEKVMQMYLTVLERIAMDPGMNVSEFSASGKKKLNIANIPFEIECNETNERYDLIGLK